MDLSQSVPPISGPTSMRRVEPRGISQAVDIDPEDSPVALRRIVDQRRASSRRSDLSCAEGKPPEAGICQLSASRLTQMRVSPHISWCCRPSHQLVRMFL